MTHLLGTGKPLAFFYSVRYVWTASLGYGLPLAVCLEPQTSFDRLTLYIKSMKHALFTDARGAHPDPRESVHGRGEPHHPLLYGRGRQELQSADARSRGGHKVSEYTVYFKLQSTSCFI